MLLTLCSQWSTLRWAFCGRPVLSWSFSTLWEQNTQHGDVVIPQNWEVRDNQAASQITWHTQILLASFTRLGNPCAWFISDGGHVLERTLQMCHQQHRHFLFLLSLLISGGIKASLTQKAEWAHFLLEGKLLEQGEVLRDWAFVDSLTFPGCGLFCFIFLWYLTRQTCFLRDVPPFSIQHGLAASPFMTAFLKLV